MIAELLLVLLLYLTLFFIWWRFQHLINIMADVESILNDVVDTEQHKKQEELKGVIDKDKAHLLGYKWTHKSDEIINKTYAEYRQRKLNEKGEKNGKVLGRHVINLYSTGISQWLKIKDVNKLRHDIKDDPIIKDQMANLGFLFVCTFGDYLAPTLMIAHTYNNPDCGDENESYESEVKIHYTLAVNHKV